MPCSYFLRWKVNMGGSGKFELVPEPLAQVLAPLHVESEVRGASGRRLLVPY